MKEYLVVRFCNKQDGTVAAPVASFDDKTSAEKEFFREKWAELLGHPDPYYNPQFLSENAGFHMGLTINDIQE